MEVSGYSCAAVLTEDHKSARYQLILIKCIAGREARQPSRTQRSATAAAEISSLAPAGIDARSLAAAPPPRFTITRVQVNAPESRSDRGGFRGRDFGPSDGRGGRGSFGGIGARGGQRGGMRGRGRGGMRGRGRGGARGGRGGRKRGRGTDNASSEDNQGAGNYSPEEQAYLNGVEMGILTPATVGTTTLEVLEPLVPSFAMSSTPMSTVATIRSHMRAIAGEHGHEYLSYHVHARHYKWGKGTLFLDDADKKRADNDWSSYSNKDRSHSRYKAPRNYDTLEEAERGAILETLARGQYEPIKPMAKGDTLSIVDSYTQKNETYLPKDGAALRARVQRLLPAVKPPTKAAPQKQAAA